MNDKLKEFFDIEFDKKELKDKNNNYLNQDWGCNTWIEYVKDSIKNLKILVRGRYRLVRSL